MMDRQPRSNAGMLSYMNEHTVLIIGESIFAETLAATLGQCHRVIVQASAPTLDAALDHLAQQIPDVVVIASANEVGVDAAGRLLLACPDLAIIHAGLDMDNVQVITSHSIGRRMADLIAAIEQLPIRSDT
jgi:ABC-type hemin transport system substrate-binding protein